MDDNSHQRLLASVPKRLQDITAGVNAYNMVLRLENKILAEIGSATSKQARDTDQQTLMHCRIVGHFFHYVPTDKGSKNVVQEVSSTGGDEEKLLAVGKLYYEHCFRLFRSAKGRTLTHSHYLSRPSSSTLVDMIKAKLEDAPQSHQTAKNRALVRDGFRCVVSGVYDSNSAKESAELQEDPQANFAVTECAHIFAQSTNAGVTEGSKNANCATTVCAFLSRFCYDKLPDEINGTKVHRLENVMTLEHTVHMYFDALELWLAPTDEENQYMVEGRFPRLLAKYPPVVTFTTVDKEKLPLPSRDYLAIHAACAKVAHLSGAAEYIDTVLRDMEEIGVLAEDGSSAKTLEHAILAAQRDGILV